MTWLPAKDKVVRAVRVELCVAVLVLVPAFPCNPCCPFKGVALLLLAALSLLPARRPFGVLAVDTGKVDVSDSVVVLYGVGADAATIPNMTNAANKRRTKTLGVFIIVKALCLKLAADLYPKIEKL